MSNSLVDVEYTKTYLDSFHDCQRREVLRKLTRSIVAADDAQRGCDREEKLHGGLASCSLLLSSRYTHNSKEHQVIVHAPSLPPGADANTHAEANPGENQEDNSAVEQRHAVSSDIYSRHDDILIVRSVMRSEDEGDEDGLAATKSVSRIYTACDATSHSHQKEMQRHFR